MRNLQDTYSLNNGTHIPCIGFGTLGVRGGREAFETIMHAIELGYRHIDTAAAYGNERIVGEAVTFSEVPRSELFITSKLLNENHGYDKALAACEDSLVRLGLDYLDLYLIHSPVSTGAPEHWDRSNLETWRAFEKLYAEGLVRAIGFSNFSVHRMRPVLDEAIIEPAVNQIECHPGYNQEEIRAFCRERNILIEAWGPLGKGDVLSDPRLSRIARFYGKSTAQLCIRWSLQHGMVPLPKSAHVNRMRENADVFDFEISKQDMAYLDGLPEFGFSGFDPEKDAFRAFEALR